MAYRDVLKGIHYPEKTSARYKRLDGLDRLRQGTLYDHIKASFDDEYDGSGNYVPMRQRRPSIIWEGARMLVDQLAGLLWGDEQMPIVRTYYGEEPSEQDRAAERAIQQISEGLHLDAVMDEVTDAASSGSCAVILRATPDKRLYHEVVPGKECTPVFDPRNPLQLVRLEQLYPTTGANLAEIGYEIASDDLDRDFWFRVTIDDTNETRYFPMRDDRYERLGQKDTNGDVIAWEIDEDNSWEHEWPTLPVLWVKSPSRGTRNIDGECLYGNIVDILVSIDYDLSQLERGFRYSADPMLAIKRGELAAGARPLNPVGAENKDLTQRVNGKIVKSPTNVLDVPQGGDAKMLEISGQGLDKMREFVKTLREWGLEIAGGMKSDASTTKGVESGRALEILYQNLILVLKRWRVALGDMAYLALIRMLLAAINADIIAVDGVATSVPADTAMHLSWPEWMTPSGAELLATANAWQTLAGGSTMAPVPILPRSLITRVAASNIGVTDVSNVIDELGKQVDADDKKAQEQAKQEAALANTSQPNNGEN